MNPHSSSTEIVLGGEVCTARVAINSPKGGMVTLAGIDISEVPVVSTEVLTTELYVETLATVNNRNVAVGGTTYKTSVENTYSQSLVCDCIKVDTCPNVSTIKAVKANIEARIADF